jgi:hypothetical protein
MSKAPESMYFVIEKDQGQYSATRLFLVIFKEAVETADRFRRHVGHRAERSRTMAISVNRSLCHVFIIQATGYQRGEQQLLR